MDVHVTEQTMATVRQAARDVHSLMVGSYTFDGSAIKPAPAVALRDTIAAKLVEPGDLLRVQLEYPEAGPDDRWYAACEVLLGGGIEHKGRRYKVLGGSSSLKKGVLWCAADDVRERLHRYFRTSQEVLSYLGVFFSGCHQGIHRLEGMRGIVVEDSEYGTADGMGFISPALLDKLNLPRRQIQVRLVSDVAGEEWLAKGTLMPMTTPWDGGQGFVTSVTGSAECDVQPEDTDYRAVEGKTAKFPPRNVGDLGEVGDVDFILPKSMIKGTGAPPDSPWSVWFGIRDTAKARPYASSFSFAQWFDDRTLDAVWPVADQRLDAIRSAMSDRDSALRFLGLLKSADTGPETRGCPKRTDRTDSTDGTPSMDMLVETRGCPKRTDTTDTTDNCGDLDPARTKAEAFLEAGVEPDHPWLQRQLVQLMRRSFVEIALGGGIELTGRMGAWADLPDGVICAHDLPAGPVVLSRYPVRDPHSIMAVWNEPDAVKDALPGTVYLSNTDALQLDGDFDGDNYIVCTQEAVVDAVSSPDWYPDYRRQDAPPKRRLNDPLSALPFVAVSSLGNRIGSITYAISGTLHQGKIAKTANLANNPGKEVGDVDPLDERLRMERIAKLSASLQAEVQSLKWDTRADRSLLDDPATTIPDYIASAKTDRDLFVRHAGELDGDFPLIRNYNRVARAWQVDLPATRSLLDFKCHVPIWQVPAALNHVEEARAVVQTYSRWVATIIQQVKDPTQDDLAGPIGFLEAWDRSKTDDRDAWAAALWHVVHGTRAETTGSAAFHAFTVELVALIADTAQLPVPVMQAGDKCGVAQQQTDSSQPDRAPQYGTKPAAGAPQSHPWPNGDPVTIPLSGAIAAAGDRAQSVCDAIHQLAGDGAVAVRTATRESYGAGFYAGNLFLGTIPKDHLLYGSVPAGLRFPARLILRGRTVYLMPATSDWLVSVQN